MSFRVGENIGPYKIVEYIGQGGMATIYRAHHVTLDRDVALKVMHPVLKDDQAFLNRLNREAAIIAKLNHPNIVTVFDYSQHEGVPFLVLRYIEGKTLKEVLHQQKLSTSQILNIIRPVADALTYAHSRGVLHRDVKPSNILIDNEGHVYLTDFGLARIAHSGESTASHDMMIGTPHYISPEQAKSEHVDARSDIYALGVVLYEMFTGRVPFSGDTPYATILAQINEPPPAPRLLNPKIRPVVEQVILKALEKDPKERYASIREMMRALENAVRGPKDVVEETEEPAAAIPLEEYKPSRSQSLQELGDQLKTRLSPESRQASPLLVVGGALLALIVLAVCIIGLGTLALQASSSTIVNTPRATGVSKQVTLAPTLPGASPGVKSPTEPVAIAVPTAVVAPATVPPSIPTATRQPAAPVITARGKIAYSVATGESAEQHAIWIANADGSNPQKILEFALWPSVSPDGRQIAYYRMKDEGLYVANLDGSNARRIVPGETCCVQWSRDSKRLLYVRGKLKAGDTKINIINPDGTGNTELIPGFNPSWSPDGSKIVYAGCQPNTTQCGLFIFDLKTRNSTMITRDGGGNPQWSPHGDKIVYQAGSPNVFVVNVDGSGLKQLTFGKSNDGQPTWSSDGNSIFWRSDQDGKGWAILSMRADGTDKRLVIPNAPPDGDRWGHESLSTF